MSSVSLAALSLNTRPLSAPPSSLSWQLDEPSLLESKIEASGLTVIEGVTEVAAAVRENVRVRRGFYLEGPPGSIASTYLHMSPSTGLGNIASVVLLQPAGPLNQQQEAKVAELAYGLAMHAAGLKPLYLDRDSVPPDALDKERSILMDQAQGTAKGKTPAILAKMVEGRLVKYYEETCLLDQKYLLDDSMSIRSCVSKLSKEVGQTLTLSAFLRVKCGEGLEPQDHKADFAEEVSRMATSP